MEKTVEQIINNFKILNSQITDAVTAMSLDARQLVQKSAANLFDAVPEIDHIFWTQYTPYFNDGEPCSFSVHECFYVLVEDVDSDYIYHEGSYLYTEHDYARSIKAREDLLSFNADPDAWRTQYRKDYLKNYGRECLYAEAHIRPYPSNIDDIEQEISTIYEQRNRYSEADIARINAAFSAFTSALALIPDDIMRSIYGDHARVVINRNGTEVDSYDHD